MVHDATRRPRISPDPPRRPLHDHLRVPHATEPRGRPYAHAGTAPRVVTRRAETSRDEVVRLRYVDGQLRREIADKLLMTEIDVSRILKDEIVRSHARTPNPDPQAA